MWLLGNRQKKSKIKLGLVLSGGGTRGFGHIGAIRAFEEAGIKFDYVSGTSAGSIVGALYAKNIKSAQMMELSKLIVEKEIRNSKLFFMPSDSGNIERLVTKLIGGTEFKDLSVPFSCVAVDIVTATEVIFNSGSVAKAVSASCSVPVYFTPVIDGKRILVDGGLLNTIPSDVVLNMGAQYVVAVDLNSGRGAGTTSTKITDMLMATWRIAMKSSSIKGTLYSDTIITPDLGNYKSTKLEGAKDMVEEGYRAAKAAIPKILYDIENKIVKVQI